MNFDPENTVVKLCAQGMQAEAEGEIEEANACFKQAWEAATNDFERFIAAHYCARNQPDPLVNLQWNLDALKYAQAIHDESIKGHYPSLYLNIGKSYETIGDLPSAGTYYQLAADNDTHLPEGGYGNMLKAGIADGLKRAGLKSFSNTVLDGLISIWCERKDLRPLSLLLPAYLQCMGTEGDINKLITALSYLSATRCLDVEEQVKVEGVIAELAG
jgi:tetratricopeptide (TPR) repeat protein